MGCNCHGASFRDLIVAEAEFVDWVEGKVDRRGSKEVTFERNELPQFPGSNAQVKIRIEAQFPDPDLKAVYIELMGNSIQPKWLKIAVTLAGNSASIQKMFKRVADCASGAIGLQRSECTTVSGCAGKGAVDYNLCHHQLPACLLTSALMTATAMKSGQEG